MSSQDVIELGSSEDESEKSRPPRKSAPKVPQKRPVLNAMVHIPTGRGSSIPRKFGIPKMTHITGSSKVGAITVKSNKNLGLINNSNLPNVTIKPIKRVSSVPTRSPISPITVRNPLTKNVSGPTSAATKHNKTPLHVSNKTLGKVKISPGSVNFQGPSFSNIMQRIDPKVKKAVESKMTPEQKLALQQKKTPHKSALKLPPGIIVKNITNNRTGISEKNVTKNSPQLGQLKRPTTIIKPIPVPKKVRRQQLVPVTVETVELDADDDDDQPEPSSSAVQWYLRPEDIIEKQNENEPKPQKIFEITIEDSPIKPIQNKRTHEVEREISITIDDSPVKPPDINGKDNQADDSSDEKRQNTPSKSSSRKKLNYPKETESQSFDEKTIEIEIEPFSCDPLSDNVAERLEDEQQELIIEIQESPVRKKRRQSPDERPEKCRSANEAKLTSTDKPAVIDKPAIASKPAIADKLAIADKPAVTFNEKIILLNDEEYKDFHPVYTSFIELCFKLDDTEDMKKIVDKKIKPYYLQVPKDYTESEEFVELVSGKMDLMKAGPEKMFLYIKDVVDELNIQRKLARMPYSGKEKEKKEKDARFIFDDLDVNVKRRRQINKLEKTLKKLHRAINKLEEQEVDFDDDGDSVYILTERYKERLIRVHAKLCQLSNVKMPSEPGVSIDVRPGQPAGPAMRLEKWINRRVPIGAPLPFPDFHDVLRCVKEANKEDNLGWNDVDVMEEARDLFTRCGKKLQRRRQENEWRVAASRLTAEADPAELSDDLKRKLDANRRAAFSKETDLINKYVDRQNLLKLEAVEIGDHEAEESPVESEDETHDDGDDDTKLDNSQERKKRLKRLLKKKNSDYDKKDVQDIEINKENSRAPQKADVVLPASISPTKDLEVSELETDKNYVTSNIESKESNIIEKIKEMDDDLSEKKNKTNKERSDIVRKTSKDDKDKSVKTKDRQQSVETLSDEEREKIDSDIDDLHLLQKLHSDEGNSSDSESLIAISDSMESGDEKGKINSSDEVSIENSSSESEQGEKVDDKYELKNIQDETNSEETEERMSDELEFNDDDESTSYDPFLQYTIEYKHASFDPVLLRSRETSDDSTESENQNNTRKKDTYTNLKYLDLYIGDKKTNKSINKEVKSSDKSDEINYKELKEVDKSSVNSHKDCDSESNEAKSNKQIETSDTVNIPIKNDANYSIVKEINKPTNKKVADKDKMSLSDEANKKELKDVENDSINSATKGCKVNESKTLEICANSPINCDSESNEAKRNDKSESSETVTLAFETDKTSDAMDEDIASKGIDVENPKDKINKEVGIEHTGNDDHSDVTDMQVTTENMEVDVNCRDIEVEIPSKDMP